MTGRVSYRLHTTSYSHSNKLLPVSHIQTYIKDQLEMLQMFHTATTSHVHTKNYLVEWD